MADTTPLTHADWQARAAAVKPQGRHFIGGQLLPSRSGATFDCINPATGAVLAQVARGDAADIDLAVSSALPIQSDTEPAARLRAVGSLAPAAAGCHTIDLSERGVTRCACA